MSRMMKADFWNSSEKFKNPLHYGDFVATFGVKNSQDLE